MFRLFGDEAVAGRSLGGFSYPPFRYRQYMAMAFFCDRIKAAGFLDLANIARRVFDDTYTAIEYAFPAFTKGAFSIEGLHEVVSPAGRAYMRQLQEGWTGHLKKELLPLCYADKLPKSAPPNHSLRLRSVPPAPSPGLAPTRARAGTLPS